MTIAIAQLGFSQEQISVTVPIYIGAWSGLSAFPAASNAGRWASITSPFQGDFVSDGTYWRPLNGYASLYKNPTSSLAVPCATLTGNGAIQYFTLATPCLLPAGLLYPGSTIEVSVFFAKAGTHTGAMRSALATSAAGAGATGLGVLSSSASNPSYVRGSTEALITATGLLRTGTQSMFGATAFSASGTIGDIADAAIGSADRFIVFGIEASYTDSAASLIGYHVALRG